MSNYDRRLWVGVWVLMCVAGGAAADDRPVVFYASDPIRPGETALLFGGAIGQDVIAEGCRLPDDPAPTAPAGPTEANYPSMQRLTVLQASDLCAKVLLPADWKPGVFAVRLGPEAAKSTTVVLNRAQPWWWLGGDGNVAHPGEPIRVFGKNFGTRATAWLVQGLSPIKLTTRSSEPYAATFDLPLDLPMGEYPMVIYGGAGGQSGCGTIKIVVAARPSWPDRTFDVSAYGAVGDGKADDTAAFQAALVDAANNHGGVVWAPRGTYRITAKLTLAPNTILRGEKRELVWLYVPKDLPELDTVIAGSRDMGVENLSIVSQTAKRLIVCPDDPTVYSGSSGGNPPEPGCGAHLRNLRLHHLRYAHRPKPDSPLRSEQSGPPTVFLYGPDMEVSDCDIVSSGMPICMRKCHHCRIERNHLQTGRQGWYGIWDLDESTFIGNEIEGRDLEGSFGGVQGRCDRGYFAGNHYHDAYGDEREALTFDTPYYDVWMDRAVKIDDRTITAAGVKWKPGAMKDMACLIAFGNGMGQYLHVATNTEDSLTVDQPWAIAPDESSVFAVRASKSQVVVTNNTFADASVAVQLYANCWGFILDNNKAERTGGMYGIGTDQYNTQRKQRRFSTSSFCQYLNNDLSQGFIYQQGPFMIGILGPCASGGTLEPPGVPVIGNVVRGNVARGNYMVGALHAGPHPFFPPKSSAGCFGRDTLIENNTISDGGVAVDVYPNYVDTLLRNNRVSRCVIPLHDDGTNTAIHPAERLRYAVDLAKLWPPVAGKLDAITMAIEDLAAAPANAATMEKAAGLRAQLWAVLARAGTEEQPVPGNLLVAMIGWRYEVDPGSSIRQTLAAGRQGAAELRMQFRTEPWSPQVTARCDVIPPDGWEAAPGQAAVILEAAAPATAKVRLTVPAASPLRRLRVRWRVSLADVPLIAEDTVDVSPDAQAGGPTAIPATSRPHVSASSTSQPDNLGSSD